MHVACTLNFSAELSEKLKIKLAEKANVYTCSEKRDSSPARAERAEIGGWGEIRTYEGREPSPVAVEIESRDLCCAV